MEQMQNNQQLCLGFNSFYGPVVYGALDSS